jgi:predicted phosphodiesterase
VQRAIALSMRLGLIGDVHQEDLNLAWGLSYLQDQRVDLVLCVGDIADGSGNLDTCCELLESHGVVTVRGNHDRWFLAQEMRELPEAAALGTASLSNQQWGGCPLQRPSRRRQALRYCATAWETAT